VHIKSMGLTDPSTRDKDEEVRPLFE